MPLPIQNDPNAGGTSIVRRLTPVPGVVNIPTPGTIGTTTPISLAGAGGLTFVNPGLINQVIGNPSFTPIGPIRFPPIGGFPPPGVPTQPPTTPSTPSGPPTNLQLLLSSLAYVQDGQVIMSQHFNMIIDILRGLANLIGAGLTPSGLTTTIAPIFSGPYDANSTAWVSMQGYAAAQQSGTNAPAVNASGWVIAPLPNGAQISNMVVIGQRTDYPANTSGVKFEVQLIRQLLTDPTNPNNVATLITSELTGENGQFTSQPASVQAPMILGIGAQGSASVALQMELQTIDTSRYRYLVVARATSPANVTSTAQIFAIQIAYTLPLQQ